MEEKLVGLRVADLASQAGFSYPCRYVINETGYVRVFDIIGEPTATNWDLKNRGEFREMGRIILCPSQALLCQWLREEKRTFLHVMKWRGKFYFKVVSKNQEASGYTGHDTYDFAMEDGLNSVLRNNKEDRVSL